MKRNLENDPKGVKGKRKENTSLGYFWVCAWVNIYEVLLINNLDLSRTDARDIEFLVQYHFDQKLYNDSHHWKHFENKKKMLSQKI